MQFIPRKGTNHLDQTHVPPPNRQLLSSPALLVPLGQTLRSVEGQTCSWDSGACGEEGRRARQAVDCSPTRGQAPPPLPFHHQDRLMEARFQATSPLRSEVGCVGNETSLWECPRAEWGQTDCGHKEDVGVVCSEYKQLRLRQGDDTRVCSGLAEVFYNGTWGSVCGNEMTEDTATVICHQLGCGDSESYTTVTSSLPSGSPRWVDNINCGVHDESLWQCPSAWGEKLCDASDTAKLTCPLKILIPAEEQRQELQCPEPRGRTSVTQPSPSLSIPAVAFVVLGALLFLLLVVLGVLVSQNRGLRRALSKGDHAPLHEAVYEEIEYKLAREGTYSAPRWGSVLSEDPPSGYEDVGGSEGHSLSGELGDTAENYDDVISGGQHPGSVEGELLKGDTPQHYDDVITEEQSPGDHVTEDTEQNYDDAVTLPWSQTGPPAPDWMDYDDVGEEPLEGGGAF
ncbi:hypothetical protein JZ751_009132 [Albula glossodonta]|uniref:SRCR domain-containing protein n=1 Tax=Albula glossodonta TaxID=121402 RepID=A0A8T2MTF9_9TELE|nr:hypothetical protein JZ751_009132 [Albula glossodonta]